MLCHVMSWYDMICYVILCYDDLCVLRYCTIIIRINYQHWWRESNLYSFKNYSIYNNYQSSYCMYCIKNYYFLPDQHTSIPIFQNFRFKEILTLLNYFIFASKKFFNFLKNFSELIFHLVFSIIQRNTLLRLMD